MKELPHILDVSISFQPIHSFTPSNRADAPFIGIRDWLTNYNSEGIYSPANIASTADAAGIVPVESAPETTENGTTLDPTDTGNGDVFN